MLLAFLFVTAGFYNCPALAKDLPDLLAEAREGGATCSLGPQWDASEEWGGLESLYPSLDVFIPNEVHFFLSRFSRRRRAAPAPLELQRAFFARRRFQGVFRLFLLFLASRVPPAIGAAGCTHDNACRSRMASVTANLASQRCRDGAISCPGLLRFHKDKDNTSRYILRSIQQPPLLCCYAKRINGCFFIEHPACTVHVADCFFVLHITVVRPGVAVYSKHREMQYR